MSSQDHGRPNIMLLVGEDTGRYFGCYGDPVARTGNIDRLAAEGCRFDQAYSTCPVCAPARSTLVTGQYPTRIGTHHMRSTLLKPPRLFTHALRDAGYYVTWPTKLDFNFDPPAGWCDDQDDWHDRLRQGELRQPWFAFQNFAFTHESGMWSGKQEAPGVATAAQKAREQLADPTDPATVIVPPYLPDTPLVRADIARHYDNLRLIDAQVGEALAALDASGQADNTIVIFLSDHGRGLPREKRWCYTAGLQMPLIVRAPGLIEPLSVDDRLVSWVDIAPTILSLAGVSRRGSLDGHVVIGDDAAPPQPFIFAGRDRMDEAFDRVRIARSEHYHYVLNFFPKIPYAQRNAYMEHMDTMRELRRLHAIGELQGDAAVFMQWPKPAEELYDLASDPDCLHNMAGDPQYRNVQDELATALDDWIHATDDLGAVEERELIKRGLVADRMEEFRARIEPLPPEYRIGYRETILEPADLERLG